MASVKNALIAKLIRAVLLGCLLLSVAGPAHAGNALPSYRLVQCDSGGAITDQTAITGVRLPVHYDASGNFYVNGLDVAVFTGSTLVKHLDGFTAADVQVALGAVTNYDYDATTPIVYAVKFRGHYGVFGEGVQDITEAWQSSGLYFTVMQPPQVATPTAGVASGSAVATTQPSPWRLPRSGRPSTIRRTAATPPPAAPAAPR